MKNFVLNARDGFVKKFVPISMAVGTACSALMVSASAEEAGGGGVDISTVTDSLKTSLTDLATKAAVACGAVVGAGLTIFALKWVVKKIIGFFKVIAN